LKKKQEEMEEAERAKRNKVVVTFDLVGRKVFILAIQYCLKLPVRFATALIFLHDRNQLSFCVNFSGIYRCILWYHGYQIDIQNIESCSELYDTLLIKI